jgi:signal recognition particle subunit SEC65
MMQKKVKTPWSGHPKFRNLRKRLQYKKIKVDTSAAVAEQLGAEVDEERKKKSDAEVEEKRKKKSHAYVEEKRKKKVKCVLLLHGLFLFSKQDNAYEIDIHV